MRTAKNENNLTPEFRKAARAEFKARTKLKASGFAGLNKRGRLVDRREDPTASPIKGNKFLGFAEPKQVTKPAKNE